MAECIISVQEGRLRHGGGVVHETAGVQKRRHDLYTPMLLVLLYEVAVLLVL